MDNNETKISDLIKYIESYRETDKVKEAFELLVKLFENLLKNPKEKKFLYFKLTNEAIKNKILQIKETLALVKLLGYIEESEELLVYNCLDVKSIEFAVQKLKESLNNLTFEENEDLEKIENGLLWKIIIRFHNGKHEEVAKLTYEPEIIPGNKKIRSHVDKLLMAKVKELGWAGFGFWCQHEPIHDNTEFEDIVYQRKEDGTILFDNEDHNCMYRAILTPIIKETICKACNNKPPTRSFPCMHYCVCENCFPTMQRCLTCNKKKPTK